VVDASELDSISPSPPEGAEPVKAPAKKVGFFSTTAGRIVMIVGGITILLTICGIIVVVSLGAFAVGSLGSLVGGTPVTSTAPGGAVAATATAEATAGIPPPVPTIENVEVFSPRDPFEVVKFPSTTSHGTGEVTEQGTLTLVDIVTEDGVRKAVLTLNGTTYTLAEGERVGDTPWQVQTINSGSVRMLYGDNAVTLSIGQGISK
jgi:hypothetical protein